MYCITQMRSTNTESFCHDLRVKMTLGPRKTPERQRCDNGRRGGSPPFPPLPPSKGKTHCLPTIRFPGMEPGRHAGVNTIKNTEGVRGTPANMPVWTSTQPVHATKIFHFVQTFLVTSAFPFDTKQVYDEIEKWGSTNAHRPTRSECNSMESM